MLNNIENKKVVLKKKILIYKITPARDVHKCHIQHTKTLIFSLESKRFHLKTNFKDQVFNFMKVTIIFAFKLVN